MKLGTWFVLVFPTLIYIYMVVGGTPYVSPTTFIFTFTLSFIFLPIGMYVPYFLFLD